MEGIIFTYDPESDIKTKIKDVPEKDVLGRIEGCWTDKVYYTLGSQPFAKSTVRPTIPCIVLLDKSNFQFTSQERILLIDLNPLFPVAKFVPPVDDQLPNESRKFWSGVTEAILSKQYSLATQLKQELEERQREKAADRKARNVEWQPRFFTGATTPIGKPDLTKDGEDVLKGLHMNQFKLEPNKELGA